MHINKLEENLRQRGEGRLRKSVYFVLLNPNVKPGPGFTEDQIKQELADIIQYLSNNVEDVITFNKSGHIYSTEHIKLVRIRYAIEKGYGRRKKDGSYPEEGGSIHAHLVLYIEHYSNITVTHESLSELLQPEFRAVFGKNAFISKPRLIQQDQTEDYMTKSTTYRNGYEWKTLN